MKNENCIDLVKHIQCLPIRLWLRPRLSVGIRGEPTDLLLV